MSGFPEVRVGLWTDVSHWALDADIEFVEMDGPFRAGARGVTHSKSSGRVEWRVAEVEPGRAVIEFPFPGVVARFAWVFEDVAGRTRITQCASLAGSEACQLADTFGPGLQAGIPGGMEKLSLIMQAAAGASSN
jgi:hypothetical protein